MNGKGPFDPQAEAPLLSAYVDGELGTEDIARVEAHLAADPESRRLVARLRDLKSFTAVLRLKEPPPEEWEAFWHSHYNRSERSFGWLLVVLGGAVLGGWAIWAAVTALWSAPDLPGIVKWAALAAGAGLGILLISAIRERIHNRSRTRYKDVVR